MSDGERGLNRLREIMKSVDKEKRGQPVGFIGKVNAGNGVTIIAETVNISGFSAQAPHNSLNLPISAAQLGEIEDIAHSIAHTDAGRPLDRIWSELQVALDVPDYRIMPAEKFEAAKALLLRWGEEVIEKIVSAKQRA